MQRHVGKRAKTRSRRVVRDAAYDATACTDVLMEVVVCNNAPCMHPGPCVMGSRPKWVGCDSYSPTQKVQSRSFLKPAYLGEPCTHQSLEETESCEESVTECLTQWSSSTKCENRAVEDKLIDTVRKLLDAQAFAKLPVRGNTPLQHARVS